MRKDYSEYEPRKYNCIAMEDDLERTKYEINEQNFDLCVDFFQL